MTSIEQYKREYLGKSVEELPTPSLLLDLDLFEKNITKMSEHAKKVGIYIRPHSKAHKSPEIARRQLAAGAVGICTATIQEATAMVDAGVEGVLITSPMAGREKIQRLVALTQKQPSLLSVVDNALHVEQLNEVACQSNVKLNVLIDIDPNLNRTGVAAGSATIALADCIMKQSHIQLCGVQCYSGKSAHIHGYQERYHHSKEAMTPGMETFLKLKEMGYPVEIMTGGSTGTYNIDPTFGVMTELQVGSYIFMDTDYHLIGGKEKAEYDDFDNALTVLATVVSKNHSGIATIDAGLKAMATDRTFNPRIKGKQKIDFQFSGDEHGRLSFNEAEVSIQLGDRVEVIAPHCDPTVNLYQRFMCVRNDIVEDIWEIGGKY